MTGYYAAADMYVSASVREGLPLTLLEASVARLPTVATDVPGNRDVVVHDETGRLVAPEEPTELAGAMVAMISGGIDPAHGRRAYERACEVFDVRETAREYVQLYRRA